MSVRDEAFLSEHEAVFAATAHHLVACRLYTEASEVLSVCHRLQGRPATTRELRARLEAVRELTTRLFVGYPGAHHSVESQLEPMRKELKRLDRHFERSLRVRVFRFETIYDFLRLVERRPGLHLGRPSVLLLRAYLDGIMWNPPDWTRESPDFRRGFQSWMDKRYPKFQGGGNGWAEMIVSAAGGDGPEAFKLFFAELRAYRRRQPNPALQPRPQSRRR